MPGPGLPLSVIKYIQPIFEELSADSLRKKCLQWVNTEPVWELQRSYLRKTTKNYQKPPKTRNVSLIQLKFGSYNAVAHYNIDRKSSVLIYQRLGMIPGCYMTKQYDNKNKKELFSARHKPSKPARKRRNILRGWKKAGMDNTEDKELCMGLVMFDRLFLLPALVSILYLFDF